MKSRNTLQKQKKKNKYKNEIKQVTGTLNYHTNKSTERKYNTNMNMIYRILWIIII